MTVVNLGSLTIGECVPSALACAVAGAAGINLALPDILSRLQALQLAIPIPSVSLAAQLDLALQIVASLQLSISLGIQLPDLGAQLAAILALIAELLAAITAINVQLSLVLDFQALLGSAGVHAYAYDGTVGNFGSELATELAGGGSGAPTDHANAIVLMTTSPTVWTAMSAVFKVTP